MARRSGFRPRSQRSSGVARDWGAGTGGSAVLSINGSINTILGSGVQTTGSELTLLRTRGILDIFLTSVTTEGDGFFGAVGIAIASDQAFTAGVSSLPTPLAEEFANVWLWHSFISIHASEVLVIPGGSGSAHQRIEVDSKAMRKFDANQVMYCALDVVEIGAAVASVFMDSRILFQDSGR